MSTFLLEVGTEELPADFARLAIPQLEEKVKTDFRRSRLNHGDIRCTSTPRRIVLLVNELDCFAKDFLEERKGPPSEQAFRDGKPTQAAIGFAKRYQIEPGKLKIRKTPKGSFVFASFIEKGKPARELLIELIPQWISHLQGRRFMRWGNGQIRFSRPIRWLVSMLDDDVLPVKIDSSDPMIVANNLSRGSRFNKEELIIISANKYTSILAKEGLMIDRLERLNLIKNLVSKSSKELKATPGLNDLLLEELTDLVESPSLILGKFDSSFLELPPEVLTTVMHVHQRYIPLWVGQKQLRDKLLLDSKETLLPFFLCISNGLSQASNNIKKGNERVLKARFSDAEFFVKADLCISSLSRMDKLSSVTFAEGLGSLKERVERIENVVSLLLYQLPVSSETRANSLRAAALCKHDLVSHIISEFPELQGVMAGKYLLHEGENKEIALAVSEQYLPKSSSDSLPTSDSGSILALAERFELLVSIFSKGERPSGSSDPYALRRAANGILQIIWANKWQIDANELIIKSIKYWAQLFPNLNIDTNKVIDDISEFLHQRIISLLEELGTDIDLIQSLTSETMSIKSILSDPYDVRLRAELLTKMRESGELLLVQTVVTRAYKLAENCSLPLEILSASGVVDSNLFEKSSELEMLKVLNSLEPIVKSKSRNRYLELANGLASGSKALSEFFDGDNSVMVMTENIKIRSNRLNLLGILRNQAFVLADFSKIIC